MTNTLNLVIQSWGDRLDSKAGRSLAIEEAGVRPQDLWIGWDFNVSVFYFYFLGISESVSPKQKNKLNKTRHLLQRFQNNHYLFMYIDINKCKMNNNQFDRINEFYISTKNWNVKVLTYVDYCPPWLLFCYLKKKKKLSNSRCKK